MDTRRVLADEQLLGDPAVRVPGCDETQNISFARRQTERIGLFTCRFPPGFITVISGVSTDRTIGREENASSARESFNRRAQGFGTKRRAD